MLTPCKVGSIPVGLQAQHRCLFCNLAYEPYGGSPTLTVGPNIRLISILVHCVWRWPVIEGTLAQGLVFVLKWSHIICHIPQPQPHEAFGPSLCCFHVSNCFKIKLIVGWVGVVWPIRVFLGFLDFCNLTRPLKHNTFMYIYHVYMLQIILICIIESGLWFRHWTMEQRY